MKNEEPVYLIKYKANWPVKFESEKELIRITLGSWIVGGIEHVGSTSVPGLTAKPIIDIMVGIKELQEAKACIPILEKINYLYSPYKADRMLWFCKPSFAHREFHLTLIESTHPEWKARIAFRDYLREHSGVADEYVNLKEELAAKFQNDREAYTESKEAFIKRIVSRALSGG